MEKKSYPLVLGSLRKETHSSFIARLADNVPLEEVKRGVQMGRLFPKADVGEEPPKIKDVRTLPYHMKTKERELQGTQESLDTSCHFVLVDKGTHGELIPVHQWYNFAQMAGGKKQLSSEEAEALWKKRMQTQKKLEEKDNAGVKKEDDEDDSKKKKRAVVDEDELDDDAPTLERKRAAKKLRKARMAGKVEADIVESAAAVGELKSGDNDLDFEDDWGADDDDEGPGVMKSSALKEKEQEEPEEMGPEDVAETDSEGDGEGRLLSKDGKAIKAMLDNKNEQEDEVALDAAGDESSSEDEGAGKTDKIFVNAVMIAQKETQAETQRGQMRQQLIRLFKQNDGRLMSKQILEYFKINDSNKHLMMPIVKALIEEVAELKATPQGRFLHIKVEFDQMP